MGKRRDRRVAKRSPIVHDVKPVEVRRKTKGFEAFYDKYYKFFLIIPFVLLLLSIAQIAYQTNTTGDFVAKGVGLRGGVVYTLFDVGEVDPLVVENFLSERFSGADVSVKKLVNLGEQTGISIEVSGLESDDPNIVIDALLEKIPTLTEKNYSIEVTGAALGEAFFTQVIKAMLVAFSFMGIVIFFYFGKGLKIKLIIGVLTLINSVLIFNHFFTSAIFTIISLLIIIGSLIVYLFKNMPSFAVIFAVISDILTTLAIINILGVKLTTAGVAAFLMLIGYSVDTDVLLSTRVLKRTEGSVTQRIFGASKTGATMSLTTLAAVIVAFVFARSEVLTQIMIILFVGLLVDLINTWLQNASLLKWYMLRKEREENE